jgi:SAM-dependent methyltransferase
VRFDLSLFENLNAQYAARPSHAHPRKNDAASARARGLARAAWLQRRFGVRGKRCLEVGCGRGEVAVALAESYDCEVLGLDVQAYPEWNAARPANVELEVRDITQGKVDDLGRFDLIYSLSVWEHMRHPFSGLSAVERLLSPGGDCYISANLYRGTQASHRYREVFFPWPHLLFDDEVFEQFYAKRGMPGKTAAWVNRLSAADYVSYFRALNLSVVETSYSVAPLDLEFYRRFEDILSRYPKADLERDFLNVHLRHKARWRRVAERVLAFDPALLSTRGGQLVRWLKSKRWSTSLATKS